MTCKLSFCPQPFFVLLDYIDQFGSYKYQDAPKKENNDKNKKKVKDIK